MDGIVVSFPASLAGHGSPIGLVEGEDAYFATILPRLPDYGNLGGRGPIPREPKVARKQGLAGALFVAGKQTRAAIGLAVLDARLSGARALVLTGQAWGHSYLRSQL
jgi:hypothetical protein